MSGDYIESGDRAFQRAVERINLESDDEDSITSVDAGTPDNLICRGLFETSHSNEEHIEDNYEDTGSDAEEDDEGSQGSLDFTQSPRAEEEEPYVSNRVWNLLMRSSSPLPADDSLNLPRLLVDSDSESDPAYDTDSAGGFGSNSTREAQSPRTLGTLPEDSGPPSSPQGGLLRRLSLETHRAGFRVSDLFPSTENRAARLIEGLEVVSKEWLHHYRATQGGSEDTVICAICLQSLLDTDGLEIPPQANALPCRHLFHTECLTPWFTTKTTCPTCRFDLVPETSTVHSTERLNFSQTEVERLFQLLAQGHWTDASLNTTPQGTSDDENEQWDDVSDIESRALNGSPQNLSHSSPEPPSRAPPQAPQTLLTPINSRAQTMDLPGEQLPFDQIRWPPGRSSSIETVPLPPVAESNPRMFPDMLRNWLLRRTHEAANTGTSQFISSPEQSGSINLSPPRALEELEPPVPDSPQSATSSPAQWDNLSISPRAQSTQHSPQVIRTILELPYPPEHHSPWMSSNMMTPAGQESPGHFADALSMNSSFIGSSVGSERQRYFDFSLSEAASRQSPITAPVSARSSPPTLYSHPTSYAALSQAMQRMRGPAMEGSGHVSDTFTFGEPVSDGDDAEDLIPESSKRSLVTSPDHLTQSEEPNLPRTSSAPTLPSHQAVVFGQHI